MTRARFNLTDLIWQRPDDQDRAAEYIAGLPDASGTFSGTFDSDVVAGLVGQPSDLVPVDIDTYDNPNDAANLVRGQHIYLSVGGQPWSFEVDHVEPLGGNVVRVWCRRPVRVTIPSSS